MKRFRIKSIQSSESEMMVLSSAHNEGTRGLKHRDELCMWHSYSNKNSPAVAESDSCVCVGSTHAAVDLRSDASVEGR